MKILVLVGFISSLLFSFNFNISDTAISNGATSLIEFKKEKGFKYEKLTLGKKSFKVINIQLIKVKCMQFYPLVIMQNLVIKW